MRGSRPRPFVLLWSTGFIGAKYGLPYAEPLTFLAIADDSSSSRCFWLIVAFVRPRWLTSAGMAA